MNTTLKADECFLHSTNYRNSPLIKSLREEFGIKGYGLSLIILEHIRSHGMEAKYNRKFRAAITQEYPEFSDNLIKMVIRRMTDADFLDKKAFNERSVLTPPARYIVTSGGDYSDCSAAISAPYCFVKDSVSGVISEKTAVISEETHVITEETTNTGHLFLNNTHYGTTKEARA